MVKADHTPDELQFFSYFKTHNLISFKSVTDRLRFKHFLEALFYVPAYMSIAELDDFEDITFSLISAYANKKLTQSQDMEKLAPGIYRYKYLKAENRFIFLSELELNAQLDLLLLMLFAGKRKLSALFKYISKYDELFKCWYPYCKMLLFSSKRQDLKELAQKQKLDILTGGSQMSITEIVAENLNYLKSVGFDVKTFDDYWQEGLQKGRQEGLQEGVQKGRLDGLQEMLLDILDSRFDALAPDVIRQIKKIQDLHSLKILSRKALKAKSLPEFEKVLQTFVKD